MRIVPLFRIFLVLTAGIWVIGSTSSCTHLRSLVYLQGSFDTARLSQVDAVEPVVRKGDILSITVYSDNPDATRIFNQSVVSTGNSSVTTTAGVTQAPGGAAPTAPGYQVDENGSIVFQGLGHLHVEGLTKALLKDTLDGRLKQYLNNPYYNIRFLNYKFTIMGEVARPGIITIPGERINLLEAFALAGDMTFYGRRDNILVIRENNNKREFARLDITKPEIMKSPYFYLQQNDVVIVEPTKKKIGATDQTVIRNVTIVASLVSVFAILYSIFHH
jgi:polysaccharide biosynthesis/export protein